MISKKCVSEFYSNFNSQNELHFIRFLLKISIFQVQLQEETLEEDKAKVVNIAEDEDQRLME